MTDAAFLDPQIGFYRRANGKRSWREERLGRRAGNDPERGPLEPWGQAAGRPDRPGDGTGRRSGG